MAKLPMHLDGHLGGYIRGGDPGTFCPQLWSWIVERYQIRTVLDVGCGEGHSTRFFQELGCDVLGVDGCERAIRDSVIPERVVRHDFCHGPFLCDREFDLIWSCEFLEHVEEQYLANILATFATAKKLAMVTHAIPGQPGHHHVNCQWASYWIEHFNQIGLRCDVRLSLSSRKAALADHQGRNHFVRSGLAMVRAEDNPAPKNEEIRPLQLADLAARRASLRSQAKSSLIGGLGSLMKRVHRLRRAA